MIIGKTDVKMIIGIADMIEVGVDRIMVIGVVEEGGRLQEEVALAREIHCQEDHVMARLAVLKVKVAEFLTDQGWDNKVSLQVVAEKGNRAQETLGNL
jgi:hypothetical protein